MFENLLTVRYITSKDCFCLLSVDNYKRLQNNVLKLNYNDNATNYVSVGSSSRVLDDRSIGISSLYAKAIGLDENALVAVSEIPKLPVIRTATLTTLNDNDYYVLESLADNVQSTLLQQIRIFSENQVFVIWIGKSINVTVTVCDIKPISPGQIDNLTEIIIKPPEKNFPKISEDVNMKKKINSKDELDFLTDYIKSEKKLVLRVVPFSSLSSKIEDFRHTFNAFLFKSVLPNVTDTTKDTKIYKMTLLSSDIQKSVYVRVFIFEDINPDFKLNKICSHNIFVSDELIDHFGCDMGSRIILEAYKKPLANIEELEIYSKKNDSFHVIEMFQQYLADSCKQHHCILNSDVVLDINNQFKCFIKFQPPKYTFCLINPDFVRDCKLLFVPTNMIPQKETLEKSEFSMDKYTTEVANYEEIIDKCLFLFAFNTKVFHRMYNILVIGKSGCGKSSLLKIIKNTINCFPYFIYTKKINCISIKGKTVESLHKLFETTLFDLIHHQPSVLILDDLHIICANISETDAMVQQAVYSNRVSEMLEGLFQTYCENNAVGVLASAESTSKLNKAIYATRGNHLFKNVYSINDLDKNDRLKTLEFLFSDCNIDNVDLKNVAEKTESFTMQDMMDLANKTLFESYQENPDQVTMTITSDHCNKALESVLQIALSSVNLHSSGEKNLNDIGGLKEAKKILIETLLWPAKYSSLFAKAPLRLPSGLLLYGPPGTGKTLLAGAAARHCGLRLISIKGPELLSKYIGASEQVVRDVFQRAQSAKPCVLFFDEFDSLAPRRGHDNTGVTDRVVNQLLTQMDGIESLFGVFVLAATSRPDLLDPALLRPGRLDIHVRCSLPDESSRLEILKVLSKSLKFSSDVNLRELAKRTDGFSGADLQSVLYSAQLESVKGLLEDEASVQEFQAEIHQLQLMEALEKTKPSFTKAEQMKYEQIYRTFEGGDNTDFIPGNRATLA